MSRKLIFWTSDGSEKMYELVMPNSISNTVRLDANAFAIISNATNDNNSGHTNYDSNRAVFLIRYLLDGSTVNESVIFKHFYRYDNRDCRCIGFADEPNSVEISFPEDSDTDKYLNIENDSVKNFYAIYNFEGFKRYYIYKNNDVDFYGFVDKPQDAKLEYAIVTSLYSNILEFYFENYSTTNLYVENIEMTPSFYLDGINIKPNSTQALGVTDTIYELYPNTTKFYAVFYYPRESVDSTNYIELFRYSSEQNRVDKTNFLEMAFNDMDLNIIPYQMRGACNIIRPTITIALNLGRQYNRTSIDFNYVYIPDLSRYYFVENYTYLTNNLVELNLRIDVLMTYRVGIGQLYGFIDRNEFQHNLGIIDNKQVVQVGYTTKTIEVETEIFQPKHIVDVGEDEPLVVNLDAVTITMSGNGLSLAKNPDTIGG